MKRGWRKMRRKKRGEKERERGEKNTELSVFYMCSTDGGDAHRTICS